MTTVLAKCVRQCSQQSGCCSPLTLHQPPDHVVNQLEMMIVPAMISTSAPEPPSEHHAEPSPSCSYSDCMVYKVI
jgi:hypothetical protein